MKRYTRKEILDRYWECWKQEMVNKYGEGHSLISEANCIEDWMIVNWEVEFRGLTSGLKEN